MILTRSHIAPRILSGNRKTPEGIDPYDFDNNYPYRVTNIVNASGAGKYAVKLLGRFFEGNGFKDKLIWQILVNSEGMTGDMLLHQTAKDLAARAGHAVHVNYNALYQKTELRFVPFKDVRKPHSNNKDRAGQFAIYPDWERQKKTRILQEDIVWVDRFNDDPAEIEAQVEKAGGWDKYRGQLFWWSDEGLDYPLAPYDAILEDMETDGRIKNHKRKKSANGFNADYLFIHKGKFEDDQEREEKLRDLEDFQGDEASGNIMLVEVESDEQIPVMTKFDKASEKEDYYSANEQSVQTNIRKTFGFPPPLVGDFIAGKLGNQDISDATDYVNGLTNQERRILERNFIKLFRNFATPIAENTDFSILPLTIVEVKQLIQGAPAVQPATP